MVRRRRARPRKRTRQFGINVIETGAALALLEQTAAGSAMKSFIAGDVNTGLTTLSRSAKANKQAITKILSKSSSQIIFTGFAYTGIPWTN